MATASCLLSTNTLPVSVGLVVEPTAALAARCCAGGVYAVTAAGEGFSGRRSPRRRHRRRSRTGRQPGSGDDLVALSRKIPGWVFAKMEKMGKPTSGFGLRHSFTGAIGQQTTGCGSLKRKRMLRCSILARSGAVEGVKKT